MVLYELYFYYYGSIFFACRIVNVCNSLLQYVSTPLTAFYCLAAGLCPDSPGELLSFILHISIVLIQPLGCNITINVCVYVFKHSLKNVDFSTYLKCYQCHVNCLSWATVSAICLCLVVQLECYIVIIIIKRQFIRCRNMSIKSLQGRHTACDTRIYVE